MSLRTLPALQLDGRREGLAFEPAPSVMNRWNAGIHAAAKETDNTISILDVIGADWMGEGVTAKRISAALRSIGERDVVVNINSPGGDLFEGLAIYNILRNHPAKVTCNVLGIAASAASIIAMAGDEVQVARAGFLMIHNAWVLAIGNRNDLREMAETLDAFDATIASVYEARTGMTGKEIAKMMDKETWFGGEEAVGKGFADDLLPADQVEEEAGARNALPKNAVRQVDSLLAKLEIPRSERRELLNAIKTGTQDAAAEGTQDAAPEPAINPAVFTEFALNMARLKTSLNT